MSESPFRIVIYEDETASEWRAGCQNVIKKLGATGVVVRSYPCRWFYHAEQEALELGDKLWIVDLHMEGNSRSCGDEHKGEMDRLFDNPVFEKYFKELRALNPSELSFGGFAVLSEAAKHNIDTLVSSRFAKAAHPLIALLRTGNSATPLEDLVVSRNLDQGPDEEDLFRRIKVCLERRLSSQRSFPDVGERPGTRR